ncbi:MAG: High-affinity nickel-transporter, partial [Actinomycetota bacterium]|nr:High-affinity nickel-transporter [Actinomycetota bacterium]
MPLRSAVGRRRGQAAVLVAALCGALAVSVVGASPASAHPLGNATVNHYDGLAFFPDHLSDTAVEDVAEIPTYQRRPDIDTNHDGHLSVAETNSYATTQCAQLVGALTARVDGAPLHLRAMTAAYTERPGAIGLTIGRLTCELRADIDLRQARQVTFDDAWDSAGIGWHEVTAVADGVTLKASPFPARSISDALLRYPVDLLASPLQVHGGTVGLDPAGGSSTYALSRRLPVAGTALRVLNDLANQFNALVGRRHLTVGVGLLAVLLAMALGAGHAFLPGHGKTIMAAYLVGRRGRLRDVVAVGATVTVTHTAGVLLLGLAITGSAAFAPTAVEQILAVISGLL